MVPGNRVRILKDAAENYPPWLEAIAAARPAVHFESGPLAAVGGWIAVALLLRSWRLHREIKANASPSQGGPNAAGSGAGK